MSLWPSSRMGLITICALFWGLSPPAGAQPPAEAQPMRQGFVVGRVFQVDKEKYREHLKKLEARNQSGRQIVLPDPEVYLKPQGDVRVTAREIESDQRYTSDPSSSSGDFLIRNAPAGVYEFALQYQGRDYPAAQRLGLKVDLSFVAELCFVIDTEEKVAWMAAAGQHRAPEVPAWVPAECQSELGACLATLVGEDDLPDGLLLLLAGTAGAATNIGIFATEQVEASPIKKK